MAVHVKFFASMRDLMGDDREIDKAVLQQQTIKTVAQVWDYCAAAIGKEQERPSNVLMAVNMDYVAADALVNDGDEVAFFPPVTGG